jgi:hypothetical protein
MDPLCAKEGDSAELDISRPDGKGGFQPLKLAVPLKKVARVVLKNITDLQTQKSIPEIVFEDGQGKNFQNVFINGESFASFKEFRAALEKADPENVKLRIGPVEIRAEIDFTYRRLIGIKPDERHLSGMTHISFLQKITHSADETVFITKSTLVCSESLLRP